MKKLLLFCVILFMSVQQVQAATGIRAFKEITQNCRYTIKVGEPILGTIACLTREIADPYYWREGWSTPVTGAFYMGFPKLSQQFERMYGKKEMYYGAKTQQVMYSLLSSMLENYQKTEAKNYKYTQEKVNISIEE